MYELEVAIYALILQYTGLLITLYIIRNILYALFFMDHGCDKWWVALIPFGNIILKRREAGVNLILIIAYFASAIAAYIFISLPFLLVFIIVSIMINVLFSKVYLNDDRPGVFAVPLYTHYYMLREIIECRLPERESDE